MNGSSKTAIAFALQRGIVAGAVAIALLASFAAIEPVRHLDNESAAAGAAH